MATTLPYRPSNDSLSTSHNPKTNGLPRLSPATSFVGRSPSTSHASGRRISAENAGLKPRRCKSQYPLDSPERHVEYILVASFHIDRGPIMEHQYPAPISGDESMLAELMLPDQTHVRSQDWTIFFLHKDTSGEDDDESTGGNKKKKRKSQRYHGNEEGAHIQHENIDEASDDEDDSEDEEGGEGPPLMYVLNLVNTKQDNTVRRYVRPYFMSFERQKN